MWAPPSLGDYFPTRIKDDVSGCLLHCFLLQSSTLTLNKKGLYLHATCNSMHSPCNLCKRPTTPCICSVTLTATLLKLEGSKQLNQSNSSIIKVFDFCLATAHVFRNHCVVEICTHALCTCCQLWTVLQYPTLSLWSHCINPTDHATATLWAPRS